MKKILQQIIKNILVLWLLAEIFPTISYGEYFGYLVIAGLIFSGLELLIKPIVQIVFLPFNLLTLGLLSWIPSAIILYILVLFSHYSVEPITIPRIQLESINLPTLHLGYFTSLILASLTMGFLRKLIKWAIN